MARFASPRLGARLGVLLRTVALAFVLILPVAVVAGWLERVVGNAARTGPPIPRALENAVRHIRGLPARGDVVALAAHWRFEDSPAGRWRFVSRSGESMAVGSAEDMKRVLPVLAPEARAGARLALHLTPDTVIRDRAALKALPAGADLRVVAGEESYRLLRRADAAGERFFAEIRSNLVVEMGDRRLFDEAVWQLERRLDKAALRVLALEPGGPTALPASPRIDPASRRALVDSIDPVRLPAAMPGVAGQTLVVVGRIDRDILHVKPASGPERGLMARELFRAAAAADVNLIVLVSAAAARQPAGRNALWQLAGTPDEALRQAHLADVLNVLGAPGRRLAVAALPQGPRTALDLTPAAADLPATSPVRPAPEAVVAAAADLMSRVTSASVQASLRSAAHQQELDWRLLPGIPSEVQIGYGLMVLLGLLGVPVARMWWQRVWPPETAADYAGRAGYWAARASRGLAFGLVFVPLTAAVSMPYSLGRQVQEAVTAPVHLLGRLLGRLTRRSAGPTAGPIAGPAGGLTAGRMDAASGPVMAPPPLHAHGRPAERAAAHPRPVAGTVAGTAAGTPVGGLGEDRPRFLGGGR
jgi:hypothetical protein